MLTHFAIEFSYSEPASLNYKLLEVIQPLCLTAQSSENRVSISSTRVCLFNFGILFFHENVNSTISVSLLPILYSYAVLKTVMPSFFISMTFCQILQITFYQINTAVCHFKLTKTTYLLKLIYSTLILYTFVLHSTEFKC